MDVERVNIVFNYDMPVANTRPGDAKELNASNSYLHRVRSNQVGRAGRFGTKGLAISFITADEDTAVLNEVQERFEIAITELPASINVSSYSTLSIFSERLVQVTLLINGFPPTPPQTQTLAGP